MKVHISRIALVHYATRDHLLSTSVHDHQLNITPEEIREKKYTFREATDKYSVYKRVNKK